MENINWLEKLQWTVEQVEDLRFAGYAYIRQGKYDIALTIFEALVVLNQEDVYDAQTLGALYLQEGRANAAMRELNRALQLEAEHAPTLLNLAKAFFMLKKHEEGLKLAHILKNEPEANISSIARALILAYS